MCSPLDHSAVFEDEDGFGVLDGGEAVGDGEHGSVGQQRVEAPLDAEFGFRVHVAGRLVEDEHGRVLKQDASDADALALPAGQLYAPFADLRVVPVRKFLDELVGLCGFRGLDDLLAGRIERPVRDVLADGPRKEERFLADVANRFTKARRRNVADILPVDTDRSLVHVIEAQKEFQYGGLPGTRRPDERERFATTDLEAHVLDDGFLVVVAERHVLVLDDARRNADVGCVVVGVEAARFVHQAEDALRGRDSLLVHVDELAELRERPDEPLAQEDETDEPTGAQVPREDERRASQHPQSTDGEGEDEAEPGAQLQSGEERDSGSDGVPVRVVVLLGGVGNAVELVILGATCLDDLDTAEVVLQSGVELSDGRANFRVFRLDDLNELVGERRNDWNGGERHECEFEVYQREEDGDTDDGDSDLGHHV